MGCMSFVTGEAIKKALREATEGETVRAELSVSSSEKVGGSRAIPCSVLNQFRNRIFYR